MPLPADDRPAVTEPFHTADLPPTPRRDANLPASLWVEAPAVVRRLGVDLGHPDAMYKRRIGEWYLWRAGPATGGDARYLALRVDDFTVHHEFRLFPDGSGVGRGPDGADHHRFRAWKESLLGRVTGPSGAAVED